MMMIGGGYGYVCCVYVRGGLCVWMKIDAHRIHSFTLLSPPFLPSPSLHDNSKRRSWCSSTRVSPRRPAYPSPGWPRPSRAW